MEGGGRGRGAGDKGGRGADKNSILCLTACYLLLGDSFIGCPHISNVNKVLLLLWPPASIHWLKYAQTPAAHRRRRIGPQSVLKPYTVRWSATLPLVQIHLWNIFTSVYIFQITACFVIVCFIAMFCCIIVQVEERAPFTTIRTAYLSNISSDPLFSLSLFTHLSHSDISSPPCR